MEIRRARGDELDAGALYALLRLRARVFVVEQRSAYADPDGRDLEPTTVHFWIEEDGRTLACLRIVSEPDGSVRIGRVATVQEARGRGLAGRLVRHALHIAGRPVVLNAQDHLVGWYAGLRFRPTGEPFLEDGIPHVPMRLDE